MSIIQFTIRLAWSLAVAVVAGAVLVILHVFDVYPERRLAFAVLGVIADPKLLEALQWAAVAAVALVSAGLYNVVAWRFPKRKIPLVDTEAYVPLKEAATIAYEELRGTRAGTIIEGLNPDNVLGYYAHAFFDGKTTLYGNHPPSRKLEAVPNEEYGRCGFSDDQNALQRHGENRNLYENLQIKRSDLDRRIAELKSAAAALRNEAHDFALANLDEWRKVDPLEIWRAGCLWNGYKPHYPIPFLDPSYPSFIRLVNAAKTKQLALAQPDTEVNAWSLVNRNELAQFARSKGEMPEFLRDVALEGAALSPIRMSVGETGPYFKTDGSVYDIRRTYNLKLENTAQSKSLSDCSIHILEVVPPTDYEGPWLLKDGFALAAGAHTFVPLVTYGEAREPNKYDSSDTFITVGTATGHLNLDIGLKYTMTLRATAPETAFCKFQCSVWVDGNGRLRIANATTTTADKPGTIPTDVVDSIKGRVTQQPEESASPSWFELEQRFRELEAPLQFTRIDGQTGAAGEYWRLAGNPLGDADRRFNAIAAMASAKLSQDFPSEVVRYPDLESESDPAIRWYKALKFIGGRYEEDRYAEQINDDGSSGGFIFTGSIDQPATASATLCLELASRPIEQT